MIISDSEEDYYAIIKMRSKVKLCSDVNDEY